MFRKRIKAKADRSLTAPDAVTSGGKEAADGQGNFIGFEPCIIYDGGAGEYAVAIGTLENGKRVCAVRWNGNRHDNNPKGGLHEVGTPIQSDTARWFVLPDFLWDATIKATYEHLGEQATGWLRPPK